MGEKMAAKYAIPFLLVMAFALTNIWVLAIDGCNGLVTVITFDKQMIAIGYQNQSTVVIVFDENGRPSKALRLEQLSPRLASMVGDVVFVAGSLNGTATLVRVNLTSLNSTALLLKGFEELTAIDDEGAVATAPGILWLVNESRLYRLNDLEDVYIVDTWGNLVVAAGSHAGDAVIVVFNMSSEKIVWAKAISTAFPDWVSAVKTSDGVVYVAATVGYPPDIFVGAFNVSDGRLLWGKVLGTVGSDVAAGVAVTSNYVVVVGYTSGLSSGYSLLVLYLDFGSGRLVKALGLSCSSASIIMSRTVGFEADGDAVVVPATLWYGNEERAMIAHLVPRLTSFKGFTTRVAEVKVLPPPQIVSFNVTVTEIQPNTTSVTLEAKPYTVKTEMYTPVMATKPKPQPQPIPVGAIVTVLLLLAVIVACLVYLRKLKELKPLRFVRKKRLKA